MALRPYGCCPAAHKLEIAEKQDPPRVRVCDVCAYDFPEDGDTQKCVACDFDVCKQCIQWQVPPGTGRSRSPAVTFQPGTVPAATKRNHQTPSPAPRAPASHQKATAPPSPDDQEEEEEEDGDEDDAHDWQELYGYMETNGLTPSYVKRSLSLVGTNRRGPDQAPRAKKGEARAAGRQRKRTRAEAEEADGDSEDSDIIVAEPAPETLKHTTSKSRYEKFRRKVRKIAAVLVGCEPKVASEVLDAVLMHEKIDTGRGGIRAGMRRFRLFFINTLRLYL